MLENDVLPSAAVGVAAAHDLCFCLPPSDFEVRKPEAVEPADGRHMLLILGRRFELLETWEIPGHATISFSLSLISSYRKSRKSFPSSCTSSAPYLLKSTISPSSSGIGIRSP